MKKLVYIFIVLCTALVSCETVIDYELPESEPKIVLNGIFRQDSLWQVRLFESKNILESDDFKFIAGAKVEIVDQNNQVIDLTYIGNGVYKNLNNKSPQPNQTYMISAKAPGFDDVSASAVLPKAVPIASVDTVTVSPQGYPEYKIDITFTDPPNEKNYYSLEIIYSDTRVFNPNTEFADTFSVTYPLYFYNNDNGFTETWIYGLDGFYFSDDFFTGSQTRLTFFSEKPYGFNSPFEEVLNMDIVILLKSVSEEVYLYQRSLTSQQQTNFDPFAQPVQVYNNINQGFGIFGGVSQSSYTLKIK